MRRTRSKRANNKARAKAREQKAQFSCHRPQSPDVAVCSGHPAPATVPKPIIVHATAVMTDSTIGFWDQLHQQNEQEKLAKWQQEHSTPTAQAIHKQPRKYRTFADAVLGRPSGAPVPTGSILFAKKRKLQRLTVPKAMLQTIDLNSPKRVVFTSSSVSEDEDTEDEDTEDEGIDVVETTCHGNLAVVHEETTEQYEDQYVFVDERDEWDFVDDVFLANPEEKAKSD